MKTPLEHSELFSFLQEQGYYSLRDINGTICGLNQFIYTTGLVVGLDYSTYERRYCYVSSYDAQTALDKWDGKDHPMGGWIKLKGRGIEILNPAIII